MRLAMKHSVTMTPQAIMKHIAVLEDAGLVLSVKRGKYRFLTFDSAPIRQVMEQWLK